MTFATKEVQQLALCRSAGTTDHCITIVTALEELIVFEKS